MSQGSPEGVEPAVEEEEAQTEEAGPPVLVPGVEPKSDLTTGITTAFNTFKAQIEEHFTVSTAHHLTDCCQSADLVIAGSATIQVKVLILR